VIPEQHRGKKYAVYLRRSQGDTGDTKSQLERIKKKLAKLEKDKQIKPLDMGIVGRDIEGKNKFNEERDLALKGDIFNEGNGQSGFKFDERPVLVELIRRTRAGEYDGILVETMNRFARDFAGLSHLALPLWRKEGKVIHSIEGGMTLDENRTGEAIINSQMTWGGIGKLEEIAKGKKALKGKILKGYLSGSTPEWLGAKTSGGRGIDYRRLYALGKAAGENEKGNMKDSTDIGRMFNKDHKWANLWYLKMKGFEEAGVLNAWLDNVDAVNQFIRVNGGEYPRRFMNTKRAKTLLDRTRGYFGYPAGVNLADTDDFVTFPNPIKLGLDFIADAKEVPDDYVSARDLTTDEKSKLFQSQTQPRARGKLA
jgi:hypothetical protein